MPRGCSFLFVPLGVVECNAKHQGNTSRPQPPTRVAFGLKSKTYEKWRTGTEGKRFTYNQSVSDEQHKIENNSHCHNSLDVSVVGEVNVSSHCL